MKKQLICICMAALLSLSLLTGCGAGADTGDTAGTEAKNVTVRLSEVTHSVFYAPQYVAMSQGFFADEGLDIELSNGGGADKVMTAVVSGGADIGLAGPESCIYIHAQGKDDLPVIFAQLTKRDGSFLVGRSDEAFDWNDLRGKTIIGGRKGGVPEMTLEYGLLQQGSTGDSVRCVQSYLSALGGTVPKVTIDGQFGSATTASVRSFQRLARLTEDGKVGPATWSGLVMAFNGTLRA